MSETPDSNRPELPSHKEVKFNPLETGSLHRATGLRVVLLAYPPLSTLPEGPADCDSCVSIDALTYSSPSGLIEHGNRNPLRGDPHVLPSRGVF